MRNWVLLYMNVYAKRSVDPPAIYSLSSVFHWYIWCKLSELFKYRKYQLTERWLEGKLEGFFGVSKQNGAYRIPNKSKSKCLICKGHLQQICAVLVLCALKTVQWIYSGDFKIKKCSNAQWSLAWALKASLKASVLAASIIVSGSSFHSLTDLGKKLYLYILVLQPAFINLSGW